MSLQMRMMRRNAVYSVDPTAKQPSSWAALRDEPKQRLRRISGQRGEIYNPCVFFSRESSLHCLKYSLIKRRTSCFHFIFGRIPALSSQN